MHTASRPQLRPRIPHRLRLATLLLTLCTLLSAPGMAAASSGPWRDAAADDEVWANLAADPGCRSLDDDNYICLDRSTPAGWWGPIVLGRARPVEGAAADGEQVWHWRQEAWIHNRFDHVLMRWGFEVTWIVRDGAVVTAGQRCYHVRGFYAYDGCEGGLRLLGGATLGGWATWTYHFPFPPWPHPTCTHHIEPVYHPSGWIVGNWRFDCL